MVILVIGGSGGIGLAVTESLLNRYPNTEITATYFTAKPDLTHKNLNWMQLDATSETDIQQLATNFDYIDILINAVGFLHDSETMPEKTVKSFDPEFFQKNIALNSLPSILLAKHFMGKLKSKQPTFFVTISARVGSIEDNRLGGWISYRASKASLNMALKTISIEWKRRTPNCCILLFHPGTTDTNLSKPFQRNLPEGQLQIPEFTAKSLLDLLGSLTPDESGKFIAFDGEELPW